MNPAISTYLDALRVIAAGAVLFGHALGWRTLPHDAVILFFVLSGYLISYTAAERDLTGCRYAINRTARIATVAIPAIVLGILVDIYVRPVWPPNWPDFAPLDQMAKTVGICLTMTGYVWDSSYPCFSNAPYWSLTYEVWYYVLFGVVFYPRSRKTKLLAGSAVLLLMGPKIAALLSCWLAGVAIHRIQTSWRPSRSLGLLLAGATFAIFLLMQIFPLYEFTALQIVGPLSIATGYQFYMSNAFPLDWLTAGLFAVHMLGMIGVLNAAPQPRGTAVVKIFAGATFSIYLFAAPLTKLVSALLPVWAYHLPGRHSLPVMIAVVVLGLAMALSVVTEKRKGKARAFLNRLLNQYRHLLTARQSAAVSQRAQSTRA
ncbi:MAG: acyltransferase family protein [Afipia sp.]